MRSDYSELAANIRNYVKLNKSIKLSNIGVLSLKTQQSSNSSYLLPTSQELVFEYISDCEFDNKFVKFISVRNSSEKLMKEFKSLEQKLLSLHNASAPFFISSIGNFHKTGKQIGFSNDVDFINKQNYALPALSLKPLQNIKPSNEKVSVQKEKTIVTKNFTPQIINFISTAAVFLLLVLSYHFWPSTFEFKKDSAEKNSSIQIDHSRLNQKPEKVLIENQEFEPHLIPGYIEEEESKTSCALIIGSFVNQNNAIELQNNILLSGYELFTEEFHEFYRVGISVNCEKIRGETFLEIKDNLGVDPWLRIY